MANAKKCDRCKKCFDPFDMDGYMCVFRNPMFKNSKNIREGTIGNLLINDHPDDYVDLCTHCAHKFWLFMKEGWDVSYKLEENEDIQNVFESYGSDSIKYYYGDKTSNEIGNEDKKEEE